MNFPVSPSDRDHSTFSSSEESFAKSYQGSCLESSNSESTASPFRHEGDNQQERDESISSIASFSSSSGKEHSENNSDYFQKQKPPSAFDSVRMRAEALLKSGPPVVTKPAPNQQQSDSDVSHQPTQSHSELDHSEVSGSGSRSGSFESGGSSEASPGMSQRSDASFAPSHHYSPGSHNESSFLSHHREKDPTESSRQSGSYTNSGSYSSQSQTMEEAQMSRHDNEHGHEGDSHGTNTSDLNSGSWNSGQSGSSGSAGGSVRREDRSSSQQIETHNSQHSHSNTSNQSTPFHSNESQSQSSRSKSWRNTSFSSSGSSEVSRGSPVRQGTQLDQSHRRSPDSFVSSHQEKAPTESSHMSGSFTNSDASRTSSNLPVYRAQLVPDEDQGPIDHKHQSTQSDIDQSLSESFLSESRDGDPSTISQASSSEASFAQPNQHSPCENSVSSHPQRDHTESSHYTGSYASSGSYSSASNAIEEAAASAEGHRVHVKGSNRSVDPHHIIASNLESKTWNSERSGSSQNHATPQVATDAARRTQHPISNTPHSSTQDCSVNNSQSSNSEIWPNTASTPGEPSWREEDTSLTPEHTPHNSVEFTPIDGVSTSASSLRGQDHTESSKQSGHHFSTNEVMESHSYHTESQGFVDNELHSHRTVVSDRGRGSWNSERSISNGSSRSGVCPEDYSNLEYRADNESTNGSMAEPYSQPNVSPSRPPEQQSATISLHSQSSYHQSSVESTSNCLSDQSQTSLALGSSADHYEQTSYHSETQSNRSASSQYSEPLHGGDQHGDGELSQDNEWRLQSKSPNAVLSQNKDLSSQESVQSVQQLGRLPLPNGTDPSLSQSSDPNNTETTETAHPLSPVEAALFRDVGVFSPSSTTRRSSHHSHNSRKSSSENSSSSRQSASVTSVLSANENSFQSEPELGPASALSSNSSTSLDSTEPGSQHTHKLRDGTDQSSDRDHPSLHSSGSWASNRFSDGASASQVSFAAEESSSSAHNNHRGSTRWDDEAQAITKHVHMNEVRPSEMPISLDEPSSRSSDGVCLAPNRTTDKSPQFMPYPQEGVNLNASPPFKTIPNGLPQIANEQYASKTHADISLSELEPSPNTSVVEDDCLKFETVTSELRKSSDMIRNNPNNSFELESASDRDIITTNDNTTLKQSLSQSLHASQTDMDRIMNSARSILDRQMSGLNFNSDSSGSGQHSASLHTSLEQERSDHSNFSNCISNQNHDEGEQSRQCIFESYGVYRDSDGDRAICDGGTGTEALSSDQQQEYSASRNRVRITEVKSTLSQTPSAHNACFSYQPELESSSSSKSDQEQSANSQKFTVESNTSNEFYSSAHVEDWGTPSSTKKQEVSVVGCHANNIQELVPTSKQGEAASSHGKFTDQSLETDKPETAEYHNGGHGDRAGLCHNLSPKLDVEFSFGAESSQGASESSGVSESESSTERYSDRPMGETSLESTKQLRNSDQEQKVEEPTSEEAGSIHSSSSSTDGVESSPNESIPNPSTKTVNRDSVEQDTRIQSQTKGGGCCPLLGDVISIDRQESTYPSSSARADSFSQSSVHREVSSPSLPGASAVDDAWLRSADEVMARLLIKAVNSPNMESEESSAKDRTCQLEDLSISSGGSNREVLLPSTATTGISVPKEDVPLIDSGWLRAADEALVGIDSKENSEANCVPESTSQRRMSASSRSCSDSKITETYSARNSNSVVDKDWLRSADKVMTRMLSKFGADASPPTKESTHGRTLVHDNKSPNSCERISSLSAGDAAVVSSSNRKKDEIQTPEGSSQVIDVDWLQSADRAMETLLNQLPPETPNFAADDNLHTSNQIKNPPKKQMIVDENWLRSADQAMASVLSRTSNEMNGKGGTSQEDNCDVLDESSDTTTDPAHLPRKDQSALIIDEDWLRLADQAMTVALEKVNRDQPCKAEGGELKSLARFSLDEDWMTAADTVLRNLHSEVENNTELEVTHGPKPHTDDDWLQSADASLERLRNKFNQAQESSNVGSQTVDTIAASQRPKQSRRGSQISQFNLVRTADGSSTRRSSFHGLSIPGFLGEDPSQSSTKSQWFPDSPSRQEESSCKESSSSAKGWVVSTQLGESDENSSTSGEDECNASLCRKLTLDEDWMNAADAVLEKLQSRIQVETEIVHSPPPKNHRPDEWIRSADASLERVRNAFNQGHDYPDDSHATIKNQTNSRSSQQPKQSRRGSQVSHDELTRNWGSTPRRSSFHQSNANDPMGDDTSQSTTYNHLFPDSPSTHRSSIETHSLPASESGEIGLQSKETPATPHSLHSDSEEECAEPKGATMIIDENWMNAADAALQKIRSKMEVTTESEHTSAQNPHTNDSWFQSADASLLKLRGRFNQDCDVADKSTVIDAGYRDILAGNGPSQQRGQSRRGSQISHIDLTRNPGISSARRSSFHGSTTPEYMGEDTSHSTTYSHLFPDSPSKQEELGNVSSSSEASVTGTSLDSEPSHGVAEINPPLPRLRRRCSLGATGVGEAIQRRDPSSWAFASDKGGSSASEDSDKSDSSSVSKESDDSDSSGVLNRENDLRQDSVGVNTEWLCSADSVLNKVHQGLSQDDSSPINGSHSSASSADDNYHDGDNRRRSPPTSQEDSRKVVIDEDWLKKADALLASVGTTDPTNDQNTGTRISSIEYKDHLSQASNLTEDNLWDLDDITSCVSESKHEDAEPSTNSSESGSSDELKSIMSGDQSLGIIEEDEEDTSRHSIPEVYLHEFGSIRRQANSSNQFEDSSENHFETRHEHEQSEEVGGPPGNKWKQLAVAQDDILKDSDSKSGESDPESDSSDESMGSTRNMKRSWATRGLILLGVFAFLILMLAMPWLVRGKGEIENTETDPPSVPFIPLIPPPPQPQPQPTPFILETDSPTVALLPETVSPSQALASNTLTPTRGSFQTSDLFKWDLQATVEGERGSGFGSSVAAFSDVVIIVEPRKSTFSSFRVDLVDNGWTEVSETAVRTLENNFGAGLSPIVKDRVVASTDGGNVFFFLYSQFLQSWQQVGGAMSGEAEEDFGVSCAVSDSFRVLVGAPKNPSMGKDAGIVYTFEYQRASNRDWTMLGPPMVGDSAGDLFGSSIAMSGDGTLLHIGAPGALQGGYVRTFLWAGSTWNEALELRADGPNQAFGTTVFALSSDAEVIAIGAPHHGRDRGVVRVYRVQPHVGTYDQLGPDIVGMSGDQLGSKGSLAGFLVGKTISLFVASKRGSIQRFDFNQEKRSWDQNFESVTSLVSENTVIAGSSRNNMDYLVVGVPGLDKAMIYGAKSLSVNTKAPTLRPVPSPLNTPTKPPSVPSSRPTQMPLTTLAPMLAPAQSQEPIAGEWKTIGGPYRIGQSGTRYGSAVALTSSEMLSSAPLGIGVGVVLAFRKGSGGSNWGEGPSQQLVGKQQGSEFGAAVTLNDSFMLIGAPGTHGDDGTTPFGAVFCYTKVDDKWTQQGSVLRGGHGISGQYEDFGLAVTVSEDGRAVIGAPASTTPGGIVRHGKVYIFDYIQERQAWTQTDSLIGKSTDEAFGSALDISGNGKYLIVGSPGYAAGFATIYQHNVFRWFPISTIDGGRAGDKMGQSVEFLTQDGSVILAGSPGFENGRGRVVLYKLDAVTGRFLQFGPALIGYIGERFGESKKVGGFFGANLISVVVGTPTGLVRQFYLQGGTWTEGHDPLDSGFRTRTGLLSLSTYGWNNIVLGGDDMAAIYGLQ